MGDLSDLWKNWVRGTRRRGEFKSVTGRKRLTKSLISNLAPKSNVSSLVAYTLARCIYLGKFHEDISVDRLL